MTTDEIARLFGTYYKGGRRIMKYGRWKSFKWAIQMVLLDIRNARQR